MFKDVMSYLDSRKTKEDLNAYLKGVLANVLQFKTDISDLLSRESIADGIIIEDGKVKLRVNAEHGGFRMIFHENDYTAAPNTILSQGSFEPEELNMVIRVLNILAKERGITIFDIGANVGWYTLNIKKRICNSTVYSFEPSPLTYGRLLENLSENNISLNECLNIGLYKERGKLDFYYNKEESGSSSLVNLRETEAVSKISVDMEKMDDIVDRLRLESLDFIKCDVEGSELFVYQGGEIAIRKYKPVIFSEMLRKWSAKFGYHPNDIIYFFKEMGYQCYIIKDNTLQEILEVNDSTVETNYFFIDPVVHENVLRELCVVEEP